MSKKKLLFVVHQLNYGGVQKALLTALDAIDYDLYDVTLYVRKARLDLLDRVNKNVGKIIVNEDKTHYYRKPRAVWMQIRMKLAGKRNSDALREKLNTYVAEEKLAFEAKHFFSEGERYDTAVAYIQGYPARLVADYVQADKKIMFFHGSTDETHALHESIFDRIDRIVGVNEGVRDVLKGLYPVWKDKMDYLVNYVDASEVLRKSEEQTISVPGDRLMLCSCGRLSAVKGFDLAIETAKQLKEKNISFVWYFVGDGPEREKLEKMIEDYDLAEEIVITGMQQNPYPWIKAADIYVQPSYEEAYGLTIAEAQILCKPVVTTATVGGKILVKDGVNGLVADINASALAEKIGSLIRDKDLRKQMEAALRDVDHSEEFDDYKAAWKALLEG